MLNVAVIMGSKSDWETMKHTCEILDQLEVSYEKKVVSAHRTPDLMFEFAETARLRGIKGNYRWSRWCCSFARNGGSENHAACHRCSGSIKGIEWVGLVTIDCANAGRSPGSYCCYRKGRSNKCWIACSANFSDN